MKVAILGILFFLCGLSVAAHAAGSEEIALKLVEQYRFGENLRGISYQVATQTHTYGMIVEKVGEQKAKSMVREEIDKIISEYQPRWNKNLAFAYSQFISFDKLQSLLDEGPASKYASELKSKQSEIGPVMQTKSTTLLNEMLTKAMTSALTKAAIKQQ